MKSNLYKDGSSLVLLLLAVLVFFSSCEKTNTFDDIRTPTFKVTADATLITESESITYFDSSLNVSSRAWTFEGGDVTTSDQAQQVVNYMSPGKFATTLDVTYADGKTEDRLFFVNVAAKVQADFAANFRTVVIGGSVEFTNLSTAMDGQPNLSAIQEGGDDLPPVYQWEFEGGVPATSNAENPTVNYPNTGTFKVRLTANRYAPEHSNTVVREAHINVVDVNVISPVSTTIGNFGSKVKLEYAESFTGIAAEELPNFSLLVDGADSPIASIEVDGTNDKVLLLTLTNPVVETNQDIVLNYSGGSIFSAIGSLVAPIIDLGVANSVVNLWTGNMDFENSNAGEFPADWGTWNPTQGVNNNEFYMATDAEAQSGTQSVQISYDGSGDQWILDNKTPAPVVPGGNYRVIFWAKSTLDGADLDFRVIESGWAASNDPANFALTTDWVEYSFDFEANDAGNQNRKVWWQLPGSTETFQIYVDGIKLFYLD